MIKNTGSIGAWMVALVVLLLPAHGLAGGDKQPSVEEINQLHLTIQQYVLRGVPLQNLREGAECTRLDNGVFVCTQNQKEFYCNQAAIDCVPRPSRMPFIAASVGAVIVLMLLEIILVIRRKRLARQSLDRALKLKRLEENEGET